MSIRGRDLHLTGFNFSAARRPPPGERILIDGYLFDEHDDEIGRFLGIYVPVDRSTDEAAASIEQHTFELVDGTITGTGMGTWDQNVADRFAVVGGKGRYLGATGSYTAIQRHLELGGDGTGEYRFALHL